MNLSRGAVVTSPGSGHPAAITDNDYSTYASFPNKGKPIEVGMVLRDDAIFNTVCLQEYIPNGQRVEQFEIECLDERGEWKKIASGTTIGYKRILKFEKVKARKIRLRILSSRLDPAISTFGIYLDEN